METGRRGENVRGRIDVKRTMREMGRERETSERVQHVGVGVVIPV
jgi:hypothetical protein